MVGGRVDDALVICHSTLHGTHVHTAPQVSLTHCDFHSDHLKILFSVVHHIIILHFRNLPRGVQLVVYSLSTSVWPTATLPPLLLSSISKAAVREQVGLGQLQQERGVVPLWFPVVKPETPENLWVTGWIKKRDCHSISCHKGNYVRSHWFDFLSTHTQWPILSLLLRHRLFQ